MSFPNKFRYTVYPSCKIFGRKLEINQFISTRISLRENMRYLKIHKLVENGTIFSSAITYELIVDEQSKILEQQSNKTESVVG
jgi:hypothetical protein